MTKEERATRLYLAEKLGEQGYATYAKLFMLFDLRLTSDPRYIGYMEPGQARITLNRTLEEHQMLLTIRHEILHEYLSHEMRLLDHIAEKNPDVAADEVSLKEILYQDDVFNIAADYEISNRGYTERDKKDIRNIKFNGQIVSGLVTEDKHPDWINYSVEDMYDLLRDERDQARQDAQQDQGGNSSQGEESQEQGDQGQQGQSDNQQGDDQSGEGQEGDNQQGQQGDSQSGEGQQGQSDDQQGSQGDSQEQGDQGDSQEGSGEQGDSQDSQSGQSSSQSQSSASDNAQDNAQPNRSNSGGSGSSNGDGLKVIRGTFKDGKFYGLDGKEIVPGE